MHVGSAPEAVKLNSANGLPIDGSNPLPTTGGGGGGGGTLSDVLLTDSTGALFVSRDTGTTVTYFNLNTNAVYTPVGTISAAGLTDTQLRATAVPVTGPLTDTQLRATAVPVSVSGTATVVIPAGELIEAIEVLRMSIGSLTHTIGMSIPDLLGRQRVVIDAITGALTLSTVTTVGTVSAVTNQVQMGSFNANDQIPALMHMSADSLRRNITVT